MILPTKTKNKWLFLGNLIGLWLMSDHFDFVMDIRQILEWLFISEIFEFTMESICSYWCNFYFLLVVWSMLGIFLDIFVLFCLSSILSIFLFWFWYIEQSESFAIFVTYLRFSMYCVNFVLSVFDVDIISDWGSFIFYILFLLFCECWFWFGLVSICEGSFL